MSNEKNNMAKILKIIYGLVLFLYLFLIQKEVAGYIQCDFDADCPEKFRHIFYLCINKLCRQFLSLEFVIVKPKRLHKFHSGKI